MTRWRFAAALWAPLAFAQDAQISGLILDPSNASIANAAITLRNEQTGGRRSTKSNESGFYNLAALSPGFYRLTVQAPRFETVVREGIQLEVGENARLDFAPRIGEPQTTITVRAGPAPVNLEDAAVGTVIGRNLIDRMPLNGRGIQTLIELVPGVAPIPVFDSSRGQFSINGQRSDANYFTVDGVSANFAAGNSYTVNAANRLSFYPTIGQAGGGVLPANNFMGTFSNLLSPAALQEFKIQTSTYAPEFGHLPGGQIDLVSRSGTNKYSGSLFEYFRNDKTDASDWFNNAQGLERPPLRFNNFGGTVGGPVRIPHGYDGRDRSFFFFTVDDLIVTQPQPLQTVGVPSLAARQNAPGPLAVFLDAYPLPNGGSSSSPGISDYTGASSRRYTQETYGLRLDHSFSQNWNSFVRYNHSPSVRTEPIDTDATPANLETYHLDTDSLTLGLTRIASPNLVNEARWNWSRQTAGVTASLDESSGLARPSYAQILPPGSSPADSLIQFDLVGSRSFYLGAISSNRTRQLQFVDNLFFNRGSHRFKFGGDVRWFRPAQIVRRSNILLGLPGGIYQADGSYVSTCNLFITNSVDRETAYIIPSFAAYAQDTWRLASALTVTYGVRWEAYPAPRTSSGAALAAGGLTNLSDTSTKFALPPGKAFYNTTYGNFAPRVGFAWQILKRAANTTVLRAGAGSFFSSAQAGFEDSGLVPSVLSIYENQPLASLFAGTPSSQDIVGGPSAVAAAPHYRLPVTYQWNVTLEQSLGRQTFSAGYVGAMGRRLIGYIGYLPDYSNFTVHVLGNNTSSSYQALQLQFNRRLAGRVQILTSYTWSHSIDNLSNDIDQASSNRTLAQYLNPDSDRGSSDFDVRHSVTGAAIATLPSPRGGLAGTFFAHWSANGIFFARSALPTDIIAGLPSPFRPDYVFGQPLYLYGPQYPGGKRYNPAAFANPASDRPGTLGRNVVRGFGAWQIDFALHREMRITEGTRLQFRAEAFNIFNHPNFANPSDQDSPTRLALGNMRTFGLSTRMLATGLGPALIPGELNPLFQQGGPRTLQFALRFLF